MANIRSAYAEVSADALTDGNSDHTATVTLVQKKADWQTDNSTKIAGVAISELPSSGTCEVKYTAKDGKITINNKETSSNYTVDGQAGGTNSGNKGGTNG